MNKQQFMKLQKLQRDFLFNNKLTLHIDCRDNSLTVWVFCEAAGVAYDVWFNKNDTDEIFNYKYSKLFCKIKELYQ